MVTEIQVAIDGAGIQDVLGRDRGPPVLLEPVLNQVLEHEIAEHVRATKHERPPGRRDRRNERPLEGNRLRAGRCRADTREARSHARLDQRLFIVGVNHTGYRGVLGIRVGDSESDAGWLEAFPRRLKQRGLGGGDVVVSNAHEGLVRRRDLLTRAGLREAIYARFRT